MGRFLRQVVSTETQLVSICIVGFIKHCASCIREEHPYSYSVLTIRTQCPVRVLSTIHALCYVSQCYPLLYILLRSMNFIEITLSLEQRIVLVLQLMSIACQSKM